MQLAGWFSDSTITLSGFGEGGLVEILYLKDVWDTLHTKDPQDRETIATEESSYLLHLLTLPTYELRFIVKPLFLIICCTLHSSIILLYFVPFLILLSSLSPVS